MSLLTDRESTTLKQLGLLKSITAVAQAEGVSNVCIERRMVRMADKLRRTERIGEGTLSLELVSYATSQRIAERAKCVAYGEGFVGYSLKRRINTVLQVANKVACGVTDENIAELRAAIKELHEISNVVGGLY